VTLDYPDPSLLARDSSAGARAISMERSAGWLQREPPRSSITDDDDDDDDDDTNTSTNEKSRDGVRNQRSPAPGS
jgi:hypothetical protein